MLFIIINLFKFIFFIIKSVNVDRMSYRFFLPLIYDLGLIGYDIIQTFISTKRKLTSGEDYFHGGKQCQMK